MLDLLILGSWLIVGTYSFWYFFKAKTFQSLTLDKLALTWKLHKQQTGCTASCIHSLLTKNNEIVGFKCDCGYEFLQKRLITQKAHTHTKTSIASLVSSTFARPLQKKRGSTQNVDLPYSNIKEI